MLNDCRDALRNLRRNPGFSFAAIVSIALAIGANSAIFSMADALVLRPLSVHRPSEVVTLTARTRTKGLGVAGFSYADYQDFQKATRSFDGVVAYDLVPVGFARDANTQPQLKFGMMVSGNFFTTLGVTPRLGRGFRPEEDQVPGRNPVIVLAHELWRSEFDGDAAVLGRRVRLNGHEFQVVGVAPRSFTGMDQYVRPAFYVPIMMAAAVGGSANDDLLTNRQRRSFDIKCRLKSGVSIDAANAEASAIFGSLEERHPDTNRGIGAAVRTELEARADENPYDMYLVGLLSALVVIVLSIACGNVANLLLSQGRARAREIAVRLAIGASRWRVVRQLLTESLLIALLGGALGLLIAAYAVEIFATIEVPGDVPVVLGFELNERVLWFTFAIAVLSAILVGLVPALQATKTNLVSTLKAGESHQSRGRLVGRSLLVAAQIAGAVVLVVAATQLYGGLTYALGHGLGFRVDHRLTMRLDPSLAGYTTDMSERFYAQLMERAAGVAGVKSAALSSWIPNTIDGSQVTVVPEGFQFPPGQESARTFSSRVDHGYFDTFGIRILNGRGFLPTDRAGSPWVVVVNDVFARKYLGGNPLGKRIRLASHGNHWAEVVGVSELVKQFNAFAPPIEFVYLPFSQHPQPRMTLIAETAGDPAAMAAPLRALVRSIGPNVPVFRVRTMEDLFDQRSRKTANLIVGVVVAVGVLGLSLAVIGLYAVIAYQVTRRTREIGIRMAMGAARSQVMSMILGQAAVIGVGGVAIGSAASYAASEGMTAGLNTPGFDMMLFTAVPAFLLLTTLMAAAIPARRASRIDPQQALRQD